MFAPLLLPLIKTVGIIGIPICRGLVGRSHNDGFPLIGDPPSERHATAFVVGVAFGFDAAAEFVVS